ncbi:MAG: hypothetical protein KC983_03385 [Phycisphaerales bacterium]|nr:hypothetical protein [Phycisphaerales bacterium]
MSRMTVRERVVAAYELVRLVSRTRGGRGSAYWRWRHETAFGTDRRRWPSRRERRRAMLAYGHWVHEMRGLARASSGGPPGASRVEERGAG